MVLPVSRRASIHSENLQAVHLIVIFATDFVLVAILILTKHANLSRLNNASSGCVNVGYGLAVVANTGAT